MWGWWPRDEHPGGDHSPEPTRNNRRQSHAALLTHTYDPFLPNNPVVFNT